MHPAVVGVKSHGVWDLLLTISATQKRKEKREEKKQFGQNLDNYLFPGEVKGRCMEIHCPYCVLLCVSVH